jgi:hypothetical protein
MIHSYKLDINFKYKMKTKIFILFTSLIISFFFNCTYSQSGLNPGIDYNSIYDLKTVEITGGTVTSVDKVYSDKNNTNYGVHITLYSGNIQIPVQLGPVWYIENQDVLINAGDYVTVTGSRVIYKNEQVIIAKEVTKEDKVLMLRDSNGYPLWAAMPNR